MNGTSVVRLQAQHLRDLLQKMESGGHWTAEERKDVKALVKAMVATSTAREALLPANAGTAAV
jgi:hypothetical protein